MTLPGNCSESSRKRKGGIYEVEKANVVLDVCLSVSSFGIEGKPEHCETRRIDRQLVPEYVIDHLG